MEILGDVTDAFYWSTYIRPGRFPGLDTGLRIARLLSNFYATRAFYVFEEAGVSSTTTGLRSNWAASRIHGSWARFRTDMLGFDVHSIAFGFVRVGSTPDRSLS